MSPADMGSADNVDIETAQGGLIPGGGMESYLWISTPR
jgi:hypothetical protein